MNGYVRVRTFRQKEIPVAARAYWEMLLDWPGIQKWMPKENPPVHLIKVELAQGSSLGKLPCTRNCFLDRSALPPGVPAEAIPECVPETLLYVDESAGFIYYNMEGMGPFGLRNYLATTEVDDLGPNRTRVTCFGRFDVPSGAPAEMIKGYIEGVYEYGIINGISATLQRQHS
jgi:hypothetical protein